MRKIKRLLQLLPIFIVLASTAVMFGPREVGHAQNFGVTLTPSIERINVRIAPAIGHEVIGVLERGQVVNVTGRTGNKQWFRIDFWGAEGWVHRDVVSISGDIEPLPLGGPTITPFDLGDGPRAGPSSVVGPASVRLPQSGLRLRSGPSKIYFAIGNVPRFEIVSVTGRSANNEWLQVNFRGTLGWIGNLGELFIEQWSGDINSVPVNGILSEGPPVNQPDIGPSATRNALMTAMLLHIDISTRRLDQINDIWSTIQAGATRVCSYGLAHPQPYIPRQEDLNAYPEVDPVIGALNQGLEETGRAIDLWQQWCDIRAQDYPGAERLLASGMEAVQNARTGFETARTLIRGLGLEPTPTPGPFGLTPPAPVPTATLPPTLPDLMAFGLVGNRVMFTSATTHMDLGCAWQGLAGTVAGMAGEQLVGFTIRVDGVTDPTFFATTVSGSAPAYGPSGWEIKVADGPNSHVFKVTVYQNTRRVSDPKLVGFPNDCVRNLGVMNFIQLTPLQ